jgi:hypothetical protein
MYPRQSSRNRRISSGRQARAHQAHLALSTSRAAAVHPGSCGGARPRASPRVIGSSTTGSLAPADPWCGTWGSEPSPQAHRRWRRAPAGAGPGDREPDDQHQRPEHDQARRSTDDVEPVASLPGKAVRGDSRNDRMGVPSSNHAIRLRQVPGQHVRHSLTSTAKTPDAG